MADPLILNTAHQSVSGAIEFMSPEWLWALPALLIFLFLWRVTKNRQQPASLATGNINTQHPMLHPLISLIPKNDYANKIPILHDVATGLILAGILVSLAEPVLIGERLPDPPQERDIVFIVDTSISMTLRDYVLDGTRIDRMTLLKGMLDRLVQQFPGERIGIIIFADAAYTLVPLTRDQLLIRRMLSRIQATMVGRFNNMGEAIALAVKQTREQTEKGRRRVLVMLTDADKPTGPIDPVSAADLALHEGLPLYTIAIGAPTNAAEEKRTTGLIYEPVDVALLTRISNRTGARNYMAGDAQSLDIAVNDILKSEKNKRFEPPRFHRKALYYWPLLSSITLLFALAIATPVKKLLVSIKTRKKNITGNTP